jgi:hypothetical protein
MPVLLQLLAIPLVNVLSSYSLVRLIPTALSRTDDWMEEKGPYPVGASISQETSVASRKRIE